MLWQGLSMCPVLMVRHYSLVGNEKLEQMVLQTNVWDGVIFRNYVCCGGIPS